MEKASVFAVEKVFKKQEKVIFSKIVALITKEKIKKITAEGKYAENASKAKI